jgi:hypothetical protein
VDDPDRLLPPFTSACALCRAIERIAPAVMDSRQAATWLAARWLEQNGAGVVSAGVKRPTQVAGFNLIATGRFWLIGDTGRTICNHRRGTSGGST